jgi:hypothetical protein
MVFHAFVPTWQRAIPDYKNEFGWKAIPWSSWTVFQQGKLNTITGVEPIRMFRPNSRLRVVFDIPAVAMTLEAG